MTPDNSDDQKDMEQELALEQAKVEKIKLELELERMKQSTQVDEPANTSEPEPAEKEKWSERSGTIAFFTMFFPPLAIYFFWKLPDKKCDGTRSRAIARAIFNTGVSIFIILAFLFWWALLYTLFFATLDLFG